MFPGQHAAVDGDRVAQVMAGGGSMSYSQLDATANRVSRAFRRLGLVAGDHVALSLENSPWFFPVVWGAHYAGLVYTPCSPRLTGDELACIVDDCGARAVVTGPAHATVELGPAVRQRLVLGAGELDARAGRSFEDAVALESEAPLPERVAGGDMLYSSGTTGRPKGVVIEHTWLPLGAPRPTARMMLDRFGFDRESVYLSTAPLYHAAPLRWNLGVHQIGACSLIMERFDAEEALALIERHRVTHAQFVPTMFVRMLRLPPEVRRRYDLSSLRVAIHAAAPCPAEVKRQMIDWWGPILHEFYGGTESNGVTYCDSHEWLAHPGTVGRAVRGTVHVVDERGREVDAGTTGAVYFEGGGRFSYHRDPERTRAVHDERGWSTLGDIGHVDGDGYLYLTDRQAFVIISGGVNVYPQEIEDVLVSHPDVVDAAVFGLPDDDLGEAVTAVVEPSVMPADDEAAAELTEALLQHCRQRLAGPKRPRRLELRARLPREPTGKLMKRLLRDEFVGSAEARRG